MTNTPPTPREALQQIVTVTDKTGSFISEWPPDRELLNAARAALAAPDLACDFTGCHHVLDTCGVPSVGTAHHRIRLLAQQRDEARKVAACKGCGGTVGDHFAPDQGGCPGSFEIDGVQMVPLAGRDEARRTLPPDVREALACAADYGPMDYGEWRRKWGCSGPELAGGHLSAKCSAVLAKYPDTAPVPAERDFEKVLDAPMGSITQEQIKAGERAVKDGQWVPLTVLEDGIRRDLRNEMDAEIRALKFQLADKGMAHETEKAAWIRERDELIAERDNAKSGLNRLVASLNDANRDAATWRNRAEWLLSELRKEES